MTKPDEIIERAEIALHKLLLSATRVDWDVRNEADDAVKALTAAALRARSTQPGDRLGRHD